MCGIFERRFTCTHTDRQLIFCSQAPHFSTHRFGSPDAMHPPPCPPVQRTGRFLFEDFRALDRCCSPECCEEAVEQAREQCLAQIAELRAQGGLTQAGIAFWRETLGAVRERHRRGCEPHFGDLYGP